MVNSTNEDIFKLVALSTVSLALLRMVPKISKSYPLSNGILTEDGDVVSTRTLECNPVYFIIYIYHGEMVVLIKFFTRNSSS